MRNRERESDEEVNIFDIYYKVYIFCKAHLHFLTPLYISLSMVHFVKCYHLQSDVTVAKGPVCILLLHDDRWGKRLLWHWIYWCNLAKEETAVRGVGLIYCPWLRITMLPALIGLSN